MEVRVLGPLEVRRNGGAVPLGARMERAILAILALEGGRVVPADRVVELLWDGAPPAKATAALHTKVAHLRRALEPERTGRTDGSVLVTAAPGYRLDRARVSLDADRFTALVGRAGGLLGGDPAAAATVLDEALALWRGPALGEFADENFARPAAQRLESLRLHTVELRARARVLLGDAAGAVADLQPHVLAQPLREQARAQLAAALYLAGRQADALDVLAEGRRLLREDLGLDPGPELRRLEQQILDQDPALRPAPPPARFAARAGMPDAAAELRGRDAERNRLAQAVEDAAAGRGSVVLVSGDAGMGKSALLEQLRSDVERRGGRCLWVTCREGRVAPPFWPVLQMLRQAAGRMAEPGRSRLTEALGPLRSVLPGLGRAGDEAGRGVDPAMVLLHLTDAVGVALDTTSETGPALLVFDDLHAADPATLELVAALAADAEHGRLLLGLALRSGEGTGDPALADVRAGLARLPRLLRLDLAPLPDDVVAALVSRQAGDDDSAPRALDGPAVAAIVRRAGGNPFFAQELTRAAPDGPGGSVPVAVLDVLRQRILRLPGPAHDLLLALAVAGEPAPAEDVAAVCGIPENHALSVLDAALAARLVVDAGEGRFALAHALIGEALQGAASSARLAGLHRALGDRMAARPGADPGTASRIAHHYLSARSRQGPPRDQLAALPWLEGAADHALHVSALPQLRRLAEQVLALLPELDGVLPEADRRRSELRARSRIAYVDAWESGFDSPTIREYCRLVRSWEPPAPPVPDDQEVLWVATMLQGQLGRLDDAQDTVARMAALAGTLANETAGYLHADIAAVVEWMLGRFPEALAALDLAEAAVATGRVDLGRSLAFSPPTRIGIVRAHCLWHLGRREEAFARADAALRAAEDVGLGAAGFARRWALLLALMDRDPERVRALVSMQLRETAWERLRYPSAVVRFAEGWLAVQDGDLAGGAVRMEAAHTALVEQGPTGGRSVLLTLLAETVLASGRPDRAMAFCDTGLALGERGERLWVPTLGRIRAEAARRDSRGTAASQ